MPIQFKPMTVAPSSAGAMLEAQRRQQMADLLRSQAMQSRIPQQNGPVAVQMGIGEGLAQLGQAMLAKRAQKKADESLKSATELSAAQRAKAMAQFLTPGYGGPAAGTPGQGTGTPRSYEQLMADALAAQEAGVPADIIKPYLESQAPTTGQKDAQYAFGNPDQARNAMRDELMAKGVKEVDGRLVDVYGRIITDLPQRQPGIQYGRDAQGNLAAGQIPGFAGAQAGIAGAVRGAERRAELSPDIIGAEAGRAGLVQGAEQANTVFPNQTVTGPDGRVREGVPVWGGQIPGISGPVQPPGVPQPSDGPPTPTLGADKRKADMEAALTGERMKALTENARNAESILGTLEQIKSFMDSGALGSGPFDRLQRGAHDYGFPSKAAANTKQIEQLGSALQLARGSLGAGVSNYDAQTYSKAAGDFATALTKADRENAYQRMVESARNIMTKANSAMREFQSSAQAPEFSAPPTLEEIQAEMRRRRLQ